MYFPNINIASTGALVPSEIRVDRIDNEDGTHTLLVDRVQVGPPIRWDDTTTEHYVRQTCLRLQRARNGTQRAPIDPFAGVIVNMKHAPIDPSAGVIVNGGTSVRSG